MNGFFSKSEDKTFPRELATSDRNLNNWKLLRIKDMDLRKGEGDSFFFAFGSWVLLQNFKAPCR